MYFLELGTFSFSGIQLIKPFLIHQIREKIGLVINKANAYLCMKKGKL